MVDECINLWKDKAMYYKFSQAAIKNTHEKFSTEKEAKSLYNLYTNLVSN